jgi:glycosyltransferase involved in cell wall biosynthesis
MKNLNIRCESMLGTHHSWAVTMRALMKEFLDLDNNLYLKSINGYDLFPKNFNEFIRDISSPDIDIAYTLPRNFKDRFLPASKLKLAIYNYETSVMPEVWKGEINHIDFALPSSNFSKEIFANSGWPEDKCIVVPHGIEPKLFKTKKKHQLKNNKKFNFLNISIPHYRKNIDVLLDAYYSAFNEKDDVCLVIKTSLKAPKNYFEVDVRKQILNIQKKYKKRSDLPQVEIIQEKIENMVHLYNSCDALVSASSAEGFGLPLLEGLAADMIVIAPNYSGHLDFLNKKNSILYDSKIINAPKEYQYWRPSPDAKTGMPSVAELAYSMRKAFENKKSLKKLFYAERKKTINKFTWKSAAEKILEIS